MLRNVTAIEEWEFPYSIIQSFEDHIIIEVPLTYCIREESEPIIDEDGNVTFEVIETYVDTPLPRCNSLLGRCYRSVTVRYHPNWR